MFSSIMLISSLEEGPKSIAKLDGAAWLDFPPGFATVCKLMVSGIPVHEV